MKTKIMLLLLLSIATVSTYAQLETEWYTSIGDVRSDLCNSIAIDHKGNTFATGYITKDIGDIQSTKSQTISYLIKYDVKGKRSWSKEFYGDKGNQGKTVAVDKEGNVYISGVFMDNIRLDGKNMITASNDANTYIAKFDNDGNYIWHKIIEPKQEVQANNPNDHAKEDEPDHGHEHGEGENEADHNNHQHHFHTIINQITDMKLDGENNLYLVGFFDKSLDFDPSEKTNKIIAQGLMDVFILKLDNKGNFLWVKTLNGKGANKGKALDFDSKNNVYVTGSFSETATLGNLSITAEGGDGIFLAKLNKNGEEEWIKKISNTKYNSGNGLHIDSNDFIYLTGNISSRTEILEINKTLEVKENTANLLIAKLDPEGNYLWLESIEGDPYASGESILTDAFGNIYIAGYFHGNMFYRDKNILTAAGREDGFIMMISKDGEILFTQAIGGLDHDRAAHLKIHSDNSLVVSGAFNGAFFIDPVGFTNYVDFRGTTDAFIIKFGHLLEKPALHIDTISANNITISWKKQIYATGYEIILEQGKLSKPFYVGNNSISLGPVDEATAYTIKARAYTDSKHSKQSEIKVITPPKALEAKKITSNEFTANWTSSKTETFLLYISTSEDFTNCLPDYNGTKVSKTLMKITQLQPNTTYFYRLQTTLGNFSNTVSVTTKN